MVLVPVSVTDGGWMSGWAGGVRWIYAFSDEGFLARFARARGAGAEEWRFEAVLGARLVDVVVPALGGPCGVAVNVGDEDAAMLFPPVVGIVPDGVAVDRPDGAAVSGGKPRGV